MTNPEPSGGADLVVVANRLPVRGEEHDGGWDWTLSPGGVVSALIPVLREGRGLWIGWAGMSGATHAVPATHEGIELCPVAITAEEYEAFYLGFANATLC